jgi:hypothetical protein
MVVFIHEWVCLPCVNLDGTLLSVVFCIAVLNAYACHIDSTFLSMFLCVVFKIVKSYVILYIHMNILVIYQEQRPRIDRCSTFEEYNGILAK